MTRCKLIIATTGAMLLLGALVGSASARQLSTSSQTFRVSFRELRLSGLFGNIVCQATLEGSLHSRTITKTAGALVGYITAANLGTCATGTATILRETLPWHARYAFFSGTLPTINSVTLNIVGFRLQFREPAFTCLFTSNAETPLRITFNLTGSAIQTGRISGEEIGGTCGRVAAYSSDSGPVTAAGAATRITVTLI